MAGFTPIRTVVGGDANDGFQPIREVNLGLPPNKGVVMPALSSGVDQLKQIGYGVVGGASDAVGADSARDWANEQARRAGIDAALNGRPDLENIEDQSLSSAVPYAAYQIIKQVPTIGAIMGAELIPGVGQAATATGLARLGAVAPRAIGGGGLRAGADFAARRAALAQGESLAAEAAAGSLMGYGSMYNESVEGGDPSPYKAAAFAPLYGLAEAAVPAAVRGAMRVPSNLAGGTAVRMAKAGGLGMLGEAGTETVQNEMEMGMRNDLTPEQIYSRRLNSAVAGGLVGGPLGSLGGIRTHAAKTVDQGPFDLTKPDGGGETPPVLPLGYSPLAGTPIIFPDGSVALNGDQELLARYGSQPADTGGYTGPTRALGYDNLAGAYHVFPDGSVALTGDAAFDHRYAPQETPGPAYSLTTQMDPLQQRIDQNLGINRTGNKAYPTQFSSAFNEPTNMYASNTSNGLERQLNAGEMYDLQAGGQVQPGPAQTKTKTPAPSPVFDETDRALMDRGVKPNPMRKALFTELQAANLDPEHDSLVGFWTALANGSTGKAKTELAAAIVAAKKEQSNVSTPSGTVTGSGVSDAGGSPVVQRGVVNRGPVDTGGAAGSGNAVGTGAAAPQTVAVSNPASQPAAAVKQDPFQVAPEETTADKIVAARFGKSKNAERDGQILRAYMTALRTPNANKLELQEAIGKQFGVTAERVRQIGNPQELVRVGQEMGLGKDQVLEAFGVNDNAKGTTSEVGQLEYKLDQLKKQYNRAPKAEKQGLADEMSRASEQLAKAKEKESEARSAAVSSGLRDAGVEFNEGESSGMGGLDEDRMWQEEAEAGSQAAVEIFKLDGQIASMREAMEDYASQGMTEPAALLQTKIDEATAKLNALLNPQAEAAKPAETAAEPVAATAPVAAAATGYQTDTERAGQAWNQAVSEYPDAPKWDALSADQQKTFVDYGEQNWTPEDVQGELVKLAKAAPQEGVTRASRRTINTTDQDGNKFEAHEADLGEIAAHYEGVDAGLNAMRQMGHENAIDAVDAWMVTYDKVSWDAIYSNINGKRTIIFNGRVLGDRKTAIISTLHEVGHAIDGVDTTGGDHSSNPTFNLRRKGDQVVAMKPGSVADELINHYKMEDTALSQLLEYPLDSSDKTNAAMGVDELREELFAQAWAFSNLPGGMEFLRQNLPATAAYMERVHDEVKASNYQGAQQGVQSGQVQGRPQAGGNVVRASRQNATPEAIRPQVEGLTKSLRVRASEALNAVMFSQDLFRRAAAIGLKAAQDLGRMYQERAALTGKIERAVIRIEQMYNHIPEAFKGTGEGSANMFVYDTTREGKWGFQPDWRKDKVKVDEDMAARWNELPKEAKAWISAVLKHGDDMLAMKKGALLNSASSVYDNRIAEAKRMGNTTKVAALEKEKKSELERFTRLFTANEHAPYAPLRRFGDWVVAGKSQAYLDAEAAEDTAKMAELQKSADDYHVTFAESYGSALELQRQLESQGFNVTEPRKKEDARNDMYGGYMHAFDKLRGNLDAELANSTDPKERAALKQAREVVTDLYLQSLAENSARKSEMRRRGIAGEIDMLRSFSTQGRADAHFLAAAQLNPQMTQAIVKMRQEKNAAGNETQKSLAFREIMARHEQSMKYDDGGWYDVANKASAVTSAWMLATSPMYYLQNLTQPGVISVPYMTGKHEYGNVWGQLLRAYHQLGDLVTSAKVGEGFDFSKVPSDVRDAIQTLVERGRIDIGMDTELGKVKLEGDSLASKAANRTSQFFRSLAQKTEAINRVSTAMAAYRLELKRTGNAEAALEYADEVLARTHGDYTRVNAPRLFNTPFGKVALQFRKFQLIQVSLLAKMTKDAFQGATKSERAAARKMLAFTLGHTGALAGVVGMPGFAAVSFLVNNLVNLLGGDDEPYNLENELRKAIGDNEVARVVMRGLPMAAGVDISGKVGMGTALSLLPYTDIDMTRASFQEAGYSALTGATGSVLARQWEALGDIKNGDYYRGLAGLMPKGLADAFRATYEANNGILRRNGDTLVTQEEIDFAASFAKAIGLTTAKESERKFDQGVAYDTKKAFEDRATQIKKEYVKAQREMDLDAAGSLRNQWQKLQGSRREAGFTTQPLSELLRAPVEQAKRNRNVSNGVQYDKQSKRMVLEQTG